MGFCLDETVTAEKAVYKRNIYQQGRKVRRSGACGLSSIRKPDPGSAFFWYARKDCAIISSDSDISEKRQSYELQK